jgi:membrane fusion protein (multidrug efflux system)
MNENPPSASPPSAPNSDGKTSFNWSSPLFVWPAALALAALLFFGLDYFITALTHESTDDAFIAGHIVSIAPRISGQVAAVHILDNQLVHSNELLVEIDPADYAMTVAQKTTAAESQNANYKTIVAAYELMQAKVKTAEAAVRMAKADAEAAESTGKKAQADFERAQDLLKQNTLSKQEFDVAQAANTKAQADGKSALENTAEQSSKVDEADRTLAAAREGAGMALAQWREAQTNVALANLTLSYAKIPAPADGRVTRKAVEAGDYVQAGQQLMSIVPVEVWVVANFKESQLKKMQTNQPVTVAIDALGGKTFRAHVDSVQAGSGAQFSLLPPENATGNFVKVVQRVPVKIIFDEPLPADRVIGPGLSVTARVRVSPFSVPGFVVALAAIILAFATAILFRFILSRKTNGNGQ